MSPILDTKELVHAYRAYIELWTHAVICTIIRIAFGIEVSSIFRRLKELHGHCF